MSGSVALWLCGYLGTKKCISACHRGGEHIYIYIYIHIYMCMYICIYVCMHVCMYVGTHVRMYVCT